MMQRFRMLVLASLAQACAIAQAAMPVPADSRGMPTLAPMLAQVTPAVANIEPGMPMHGYVEGAIVVGVEPNSAAARNGLRAGDIIYGVNRRRMRSVSEFLAALRGADSALRISLLRGEYRITLAIR